MGRVRRLMAVTGMLVGLSLLTSTAFAALCVWVNPDRDIKIFFPGANSYTTETRKYDKAQEKEIIKRLGEKLDPDENEFKFYHVKNKGKVVGTVLTHQARGKYGAVQTVTAIGTDGKVVGVYVQRHREPTNLNAPAFLKQFVGKKVEDSITIGKDIDPISGHERSSHAVAFSVKKIMIVHDVLTAK